MPNHQRSYWTTFNLGDIQNTKDLKKKHGNINIKNKQTLFRSNPFDFIHPNVVTKHNRTIRTHNLTNTHIDICI